MEDDIQNYLSTVMFRGTPCILIIRLLTWLQNTMKTERLSCTHAFPSRGVRGGAAPPAPSTLAPLRGWRGAPMGEALLILHLIAFPFLRPGTVAYLGGNSPVAPPTTLKSNTWQLQRLRICLNSLLIQGERILHYTRCTMTESRLNDLALKALQPKRLSELSTEKSHWNVRASKSLKIVA